VALWSVVVAVGVGMAVGIASGVYPAARAARLDPIAALRQE
jgi:putative ABC transport system permease protein